MMTAAGGKFPQAARAAAAYHVCTKKKGKNALLPENCVFSMPVTRVTAMFFLIFLKCRWGGVWGWWVFFIIASALDDGFLSRQALYDGKNHLFLVIL